MANKLPLMLGMLLIVVSFILCIVGFGTGYWWVSTDEESTFSRAGLWEICFNGYEHTSDLIGKPYYGCWWVFYNEYYYIRDWILPAWFVACQTLMTFAVVFEFIALVVYPMSFPDVDNIRMPVVTCIVTGIITICISISVVIFGVMIGEDRTWMPNWQTNVMGWSYGLVVVSGFMAIFSFIAIIVYTFMRKYDLYSENFGKNKGQTKQQFAMLPKA